MVSKVNYRRKFKFFESENVSITVIDYGSVSEKCQYCQHSLRYHYVVDDKKTGQKGKMKVGCECVKLFLRDAGVDELLIERADKIIKKQMAALNHVRKFENLDIDKLYKIMSTAITYDNYRIRNFTYELVAKEMKERYDVTDRYSMWNERRTVAKEIEASDVIKSLREARNSERYVEASKLWKKKYNGKYRGLGEIFWNCTSGRVTLTKEMLEAYRDRMVNFYLQPVKSPFYFGG